MQCGREGTRSKLTEELGKGRRAGPWIDPSVHKIDGGQWGGHNDTPARLGDQRSDNELRNPKKRPKLGNVPDDRPRLNGRGVIPDTSPQREAADESTATVGCGQRDVAPTGKNGPMEHTPQWNDSCRGSHDGTVGNPHRISGIRLWGSPRIGPVPRAKMEI